MVVILPLLSSVKSAEAHVGFAPWPSFSVCVCTCRLSWAAPCSPSPSIPLRPSLLSYFGRLHQLLLYLLNLADPTCMVFFYLTQKSWVSVCPAAAQKLSIMHVPSQAAWGWIAPRNPAQAHFGDLFKKKKNTKKHNMLQPLLPPNNLPGVSCSACSEDAKPWLAFCAAKSFIWCQLGICLHPCNTDLCAWAQPVSGGSTSAGSWSRSRDNRC